MSQRSRRAPTRSQRSSRTTVSALLLKNKADASKKLIPLKKEIAEKEAELGKMKNKIEATKKKIIMKKKVRQTTESRNLIDDYENELIDLNMELENIEVDLQRLQKNFQEEKQLADIEEEAANAVLLDESDDDASLASSVKSSDKKDRVVDWVEKIPEELNLSPTEATLVTPASRTHSATSMKPPSVIVEYIHGKDPKEDLKKLPALVSQTPGKEAISFIPQFVSALQQAFPTQSQSLAGVVSKPIDKDLPLFAGRAEDWLNFIGEYERTTSKYRYDDSENLTRLRKYLKGDAKDAVNHLLCNPMNVPRILYVLEQRFGNPKHVIGALMDRVKKLKNPDLSKPETIVDFGTTVDALVTNIISFKESDYLNNIQLLNELVDKLPASLSREWSQFLHQSKYPENLQSFQIFMDQETAYAYQRLKPKSEPEESNRKFSNVHHRLHMAKEVSDSCCCCGAKGHRLSSCIKFQKMKVSDRYNVVKENHLCFRCLNKGHTSAKCSKSTLCGINSCDKTHHKLLHHSTPTMRENSSPITSSTEERRGDNPSPKQGPHRIAMAGGGTMEILWVDLPGPKGTERILAVHDNGCTFSIMEEDVAEAAGFEGEPTTLEYEVFGGAVRRHEDSKLVAAKIKGIHQNANEYDLKRVYTIKSLGIEACPLNVAKLKEQYPYLSRCKAKNIPDLRPKMLIGRDNHHLLCHRDIAEDPAGEGPSGYLSKLGWYFAGLEGKDCCYLANLCDNCREETDDGMHLAIRQFINSEDLGVKLTEDLARSKEDQRAMDILERTTVKIGDRWQTSLLWRNDEPKLPESYKMAIHRMKLMEKKMDQDPSFGSYVCEKFDDYIAKGYLQPAINFPELLNSPKKFYLPWFFAYHPTKKPRLVFDAAAKTNGKSLNDFLLKGPDLLNSLPDVLSKFRTYTVALTADIKEMFHQVKLTPEDWPAQIILFRGMNRDKPPTEYFMTVLFFGSASSPCSAIFAKNRNADTFAEKYPDAVRAIKENFYMDDFLGGAEGAEKALELQKEITQIHAAGGFEICKWNSSSTEVLKSIPDGLKTEGALNFQLKDDASLEKTLGLYWNPKKDAFQFKLSMGKLPEAVVQHKRNPTKREVVSFTMALFDPLGFMSPVKVRALILIQDIWRSKIGWDAKLSDELTEKWRAWLATLDQVKSMEVSRRFTTFKEADVSTHVFVDASEEAYSCVLYFLFENKGQREVSFVSGKSRVAPINGLTIPRMELQAALIGARLNKTVLACFPDWNFSTSTTFWSDSKTVLCWLRSESGRFKTFVQTRVGEIIELSDSFQWKWIPTKLNVADDATRSVPAEDFSSTCRWLRGVPFLLGGEDAWPKEEKSTQKECDQEVRKSCNMIQSLARPFGLPNPANFSSWLRLVRATAAVSFARRKFLALLKSRKHESNPNFITVDEQIEAEMTWIKQAQQDSFAEDIVHLQNKTNLPKNSRLVSLSPYLDEKGLIRLGGRIDAAVGVTYAVKRPPITDRNHPYTKLFVRWIHEEVCKHVGQERAQVEIRKKMWVINCGSAVRSAWANCQECKLKKLQPSIPEMGPLPGCRLQINHVPFVNTGVDYFGPFEVKMLRRRVKRYGVLFVCMSSGAVHIDLAENMETCEFLNVLSRFVDLRGPPEEVWSDNGRNFVGANKELSKGYNEWNQDEVLRYAAKKTIRWHFGPPATPHMGGVYERLVGNAKKIIFNMMHNRSLTESSLRTFLSAAMDSINSRPLTPASTDPNDAECITPNHLLKMKCVEGPSIIGVYGEETDWKSAWKNCQALSNQFWRQWTDSCLPLLAKRRKWHKKTDPLQVGDVVILKDDMIPRSSWKKGIVVKCYPGHGNQVRVADIRVAVTPPTGGDPVVHVYRRPAVKIIPLGERVVLETLGGGMCRDD